MPRTQCFETPKLISTKTQLLKHYFREIHGSYRRLFLEKPIAQKKVVTPSLRPPQNGIIKRGGTASLHSRTCVKCNAVFGARFEGLSLYFLYQKGNLIRIKIGLGLADTYPNP